MAPNYGKSFNKNKTVAYSTIKPSETPREVVAKFENFTKKVLEEFRKQVEEIKSKSQIEKNIVVQALRRELNRENEQAREKWEAEKKLLEEELGKCKEKIERLEKMEATVETLQKREEKRQRTEIRNDIVITGGKFKRDIKEKKDEVRELIEDSLKLSVRVTTAFKISEDKNGEDIVVAKLASYEDKSRIMQKKSSLKNYKHIVYINNALTRKQQEEFKSNRRKQQNTIRIHSGMNNMAEDDKQKKEEEVIKEQETQKRIHKRLDELDAIIATFNSSAMQLET